MFLGALVMAAGMIGVFSVPTNLALAGTMTWVIGFFGLATIGFTMVAIPCSAQVGEITQDPAERSAMTGWRMGFASIGILIGGAIIPGLAGRMGYANAAMAFTPLIVGAIWLSLWATRNAPRITQAAAVDICSMFGLVFANRAFMVLVVLYGVTTLAMALITAGPPFDAIYRIVDSGDTALSGAAKALSALSLMFAAFVVGSNLSQAGWVFASGRMGKVGSLSLGLCLYAVLLYALYTALPSVNVTAIAGLFVLAGIANCAYQQIPWAMYPDLMDVTRASSGGAIEGVFSVIWLFGQKTGQRDCARCIGVYSCAGRVARNHRRGCGAIKRCAECPAGFDHINACRHSFASGCWTGRGLPPYGQTCPWLIWWT